MISELQLRPLRVSQPSTKGTVVVFSWRAYTAERLCGILRDDGFTVHLTQLQRAVADVPLRGVHLAILTNAPPHEAEAICLSIRHAAPSLPLIALGPDNARAKITFFSSTSGLMITSWNPSIAVSSSPGLGPSSVARSMRSFNAASLAEGSSRFGRRHVPVALIRRIRPLSDGLKRTWQCLHVVSRSK